MINLRYILSLLLCFGIYENKCQNLISNGSFETFLNLHIQSYEGSFEAYTPSLVHILNDWDRINSADHYDTSFTQWGFGVPYNAAGNSYAKHGHAYTGAICFANNGGREYIFQHLNSPLKTDSVYCMSFFVSRADRITHALKNLGAYFSMTTPSLPLGYINAVPQVININGFLTDTIGWMEIQGCFTAQGGEQYVTIGNFESNANTDTLFVGSTNPVPYADGYGYYYFDSISLWKNNFPTGIAELNIENYLSIYPNPNNGFFTINSKDVIQKIEISDISSKLLLTETIIKNKYQLKLHDFAEGIYFIKVSYPSGISVTKKVILKP